jgi:hypothetical protein
MWADLSRSILEGSLAALNGLYPDPENLGVHDKGLSVYVSDPSVYVTSTDDGFAVEFRLDEDCRAYRLHAINYYVHGGFYPADEEETAEYRGQLPLGLAASHSVDDIVKRLGEPHIVKKPMGFRVLGDVPLGYVYRLGGDEQVFIYIVDGYLYSLQASVFPLEN